MDAALLVRKARQQAGLTQAELADAAGTSQPAVAAYESGQRSPSVRTLDKLIRATGMRIDARLREAPPARGDLLAFAREHQAAIRDAAASRGIRNIRVFGSAARGEDTPDSDLDLLVDFDTAKHGLMPLAGFVNDVQAIIGRDVDASTSALLRDEIRDMAEQEAVPL